MGDDFETDFVVSVWWWNGFSNVRRPNNKMSNVELGNCNQFGAGLCGSVVMCGDLS
jgi:hypothetical protein